MSTIKISDNNFTSQVLKSEVPVLVDFWADWCPPCRTLSPILDEVAEEYQGKLKVAKLHVSENPVSASEYEVFSIPTLILFENGKIVERSTGVVPKASLESKIQPYLSLN